LSAREGKVNRSSLWSCAAALLLILLPGAAQGAEKIITMSTTTSTQASGLLEVLLPACEKETGITVKVIAKGTGAAIRDGMDGNVDVIFVHAREKEEKFVNRGYGTKRYAVMHNDFVIVGPPGDPAGIKGLEDAAEALRRIAAFQSLFVSRGDDSGTHTREQELWRSTGLSPVEEKQWYLSIGQGMGKTLTFADEKKAYTLADRGTYIKYRYGRNLPVDLEVLVEGDPTLSNPYGVIPVSPEKHPQVRHDLARQFVEWLVSERGQAVIGGYRLLGRQLFIPDAGQESVLLREGGDAP
jgi:tungstate transport system substrate-binding protein